MSQEEFKNKSSQKVIFLLGLFIGIAVLSTSGFFFLLHTVLTNNLQIFNTDTAQVAGVEVAENNPPVVEEEPALPEADASKLSSVTKEDNVRGDFNAQVTLIEFSDFECPYCSRHHETIDQILAAYKGQVRHVFRHFPLSFHPNAQKAAEASECAAEQGKFEGMYNKLFELKDNQEMSVDNFKKAAGELGLNTAKFNDCLDSGKMASEVQKDYAEGQAAGVMGTPGTFVNGEYVGGAIPYEQFKAVVESHLGK